MFECIGKCGRSTDILPSITPSGSDWKPEWGWLCSSCANERPRGRKILNVENDWREGLKEVGHDLVRGTTFVNGPVEARS